MAIQICVFTALGEVCERRSKSAAGVGAAEKCGTLESGV